jgi:hypothetical protein
MCQDVSMDWREWGSNRSKAAILALLALAVALPLIISAGALTAAASIATVATLVFTLLIFLAEGRERSTSKDAGRKTSADKIVSSDSHENAAADAPEPVETKESHRIPIKRLWMVLSRTFVAAAGCALLVIVVIAVQSGLSNSETLIQFSGGSTRDNFHYSAPFLVTTHTVSVSYSVSCPRAAGDLYISLVHGYVTQTIVYSSVPRASKTITVHPIYTDSKYLLSVISTCEWSVTVKK